MVTARFIRHGESIANAGGVTAEPDTIPLTPRGRDQARTLSREIAGSPHLIVTSPYIRARDTAAPTAARFPHVPLEVWPVHEICNLAPARRMHTTSTQRRPWVEAFWSHGDPMHCDGEGAECYADFVARVRATLDRLTVLPRQSVLIFSHGQFMKGIHWEIAECSPPVTPDTMRAFWDFHLSGPIANTQGFTVHWNGRQWRIES